METAPRFARAAELKASWPAAPALRGGDPGDRGARWWGHHRGPKWLPATAPDWRLVSGWLWLTQDNPRAHIWEALRAPLPNVVAVLLADP